MPVSAIILAAGRAERFGGDKLSLKIGGASMLARALRTARAAGFDEIIVVAGGAEAARGLGPEAAGVKFAVNAGGGGGQGSSVRLGAASADPANHLMFLLADQPFIKAETVSRMLEESRAARDAVVMAEHGGVLTAPALFPPSFRERLLKIGDGRGAKAALGGGDNVITVRLTELEAADIDTPAAYVSAICREKRGLVIVRGAGDLATGVIQALVLAGFAVIALETARPTAIRRTVSLCEAVYDGRAEVEGITARLARDTADIGEILQNGEVPVLIDPAGEYIGRLKPDAVVDAIIAKRNTGTRRGMAPATVALGPGFEAGVDADAVIETMRGHSLGRIILEGRALPNTGVPGEIGGAGAERVVKSPAGGVFREAARIGQTVKRGEIIAYVGDTPVSAPIDGVLRGLLRGGTATTPGFKLADIDPRCRPENCYTISDKARCVGCASVVALMYLTR